MRSLADCIPSTYEAYDAFTLDGGGGDVVRGKQPQTIDMFTRAAKQQVELFALFFGRGHFPGRLGVIAISQQIHEAQPELPPSHLLIAAWEAMAYWYISDVVDGPRRLLRNLPDNVRMAEYRRKALSPGAHGQHRWGLPTTWLKAHHAGYYQEISIPKIEGRISKSAWKAVLHQPTKQLRAAG